MAKQTRGVGLDECLLNTAVCPEEGDLATDGFRAAKKAMPHAVIAAWGSNHGDTRFAQLMVEGTFSLAMVEAYTYCPGCGDWPKSATCCSNAGTTRTYRRVLPSA